MDKIEVRKIIASFISHPWIKLISLLLSVTAWFYVKSRIGWYGY